MTNIAELPTILIREMYDTLVKMAAAGSAGGEDRVFFTASPEARVALDDLCLVEFVLFNGMDWYMVQTNAGRTAARFGFQLT